MNGDGFDDLIIGAAGGDGSGKTKPDAGESYVIFGGDFLGGVMFAGTSGNDTLTGTAVAETFVGGQGNDTLIGGGGADAFQGGAGNDLITVPGLSFAMVDGGSGTDTLVLQGAGASFDFTTFANNKVQGIEAIDFTGTGNNTLKMALTDVLDLSDTPNFDFTGLGAAPAAVVLDGNSGDTVQLQGDPRGSWGLAASDVNLDGTGGGALRRLASMPAVRTSQSLRWPPTSALFYCDAISCRTYHAADVSLG